MLLFKANGDRAKDDDDFAATLPLLTDAQRASLAAYLSQVHPDRSWAESANLKKIDRTWLGFRRLLRSRDWSERHDPPETVGI